MQLSFHVENLANELAIGRYVATYEAANNRLHIGEEWILDLSTIMPELLRCTPDCDPSHVESFEFERIQKALATDGIHISREV